MENLNINNKCNQRCVFCNTQRLLKYNAWKETTTEEIIDQLDNVTNKKNVNFTGGGEVTLLKNLPRLIQYAKKIGIQEVGMETNAVLLSYKDYVKKLKASGLDYCIVSLHSHKEDISDWITQCPGSFNKTIKGLENLQDEAIKIKCILHTINKLNYKNMIEFIKYIRKKFNPNEFGLCFIRPIKNDINSESITPSLTEIKKYLHETLKFCKQNNINITISERLGIPLCFLKGYEKFSGEFLSFINTKNDVQLIDKVKSEECKKCSFNSYCSGISDNYSRLFGTEELVPQNIRIENFIK